MLRALIVLVLVSACSPAALSSTRPAQRAEATNEPRPSAAAQPIAHVRKAPVRRLAPPFAGSSGVRRVSEPTETNPVVAAVAPAR